MTNHARHPRSRTDNRDRVPYKTLCGTLFTSLDHENDSVVDAADCVTCWRCITLLCERPLPAEPAMPEHDKLRSAKKVGDATQLLYDFLMWLNHDKGYVIAARNDDCDKLITTFDGPATLIADFFGISSMALESEKRALIEYQRAINKASDWAETEGATILAAR